MTDATERRDSYVGSIRRENVDRNRLLMAIASVFAGLTVLLAVLGLVYQPFVLVLTLPFGATAYFMWFQASGRLERRTRRRVRRGADSERRRGGFGAGARRANARENYRRATNGDAATNGRYRRATDGTYRNGRTRPSRDEAYRVLGLDPGATAQEVKRAYRSKVKDVHPDTEGGSEAAFKRVNRAYETLTD